MNDDIQMMPQDENLRFLRTQLILAAIPTFVTQLIAFYRIHKLVRGIVIMVMLFFLDLMIQSNISWPFGMVFALPITVGMPVYFVRKWTLESFEKKKGLF